MNNSAELSTGLLMLVLQVAVAVWSGFHLIRSLRTGKSRFRIAGSRENSPTTYWALIALWSCILLGAVTSAGQIILSELT